jgi:hypothetical protein
MIHLFYDIYTYDIWHDAAQLYMDSKDIRSMMCVLTELHEAMDEGTSSLPLSYEVLNPYPYPLYMTYDIWHMKHTY